MKNEMTLTYQTRLHLNKTQEKVLCEYAALLSKVERSLFAEVMKGRKTAECKNAFLKIFGVTARQFNACRISLEGKILACKAGQEQGIARLKQQINSLEKKITQLRKKPLRSFTLHQKNRRKIHLSHRLSSLEEDHKRGHVRLCFGSKKLFNAQFHLEKNGFASHLEWKKAWEEKRNSEFFILGSKDETAGNQTCTAAIQENGQLCLRLRLPKVLESKYGKYLEIKNVRFSYGHKEILAGLNNPNGQALSYRFKKDEKSWRLFASTSSEQVEPISKEGNGVIGLDLNADHIACIMTDRYGNPIEKKIFSWISYGKSKGQIQAITGDICKEIIDWAISVKKPLIIEQLEFQKKKAALEESTNKKFARLLSSFAYKLFFGHLISRAFKSGIAVHQVNPAYTSIIGRVNYAKRFGLSIHLAAALCIARRYQHFSESPCRSQRIIPDGKGGHLAFVLPVRNRTKHVWHFWGQVKKKLTTVLAAHFRAKHLRSSSPPVRLLR